MTTADTKSAQHTAHSAPRGSESTSELDAAHRYLDGFSVPREAGGPALSIEERLRLLVGDPTSGPLPRWARQAGTTEERVAALELRLGELGAWLQEQSLQGQRTIAEMRTEGTELQVAMNLIGRHLGLMLPLITPGRRSEAPPFLRNPFWR